MKTLSFLAAVSAFLLFPGSSGAQSTGYDDYSNDGARVIINNYYDGYGSDYYYSSRINRFHRSYAVFDYYSPVFTDSYWYDYNPFSWGISIYGGGFGMRLGYSPYYYSPYYYSWYDPYYYDPYYYSSYWGYYPRYYSYWYAPSFCWGIGNLWAGLTWAFYSPFYWHHHHFRHSFGHSYYSHNHGYYDFNRRYSSDTYRRYEASRHDPGRNAIQESRRGIIDNGSSGNIRRNDGNIRNEGTGNPETRRSGSSSSAGSNPGSPVNRSYSGSRRVSPSYQGRSSDQQSGQIASNYRSNSPVRRESYTRSYGTNTETRQASVRRQETYSSQGRSGSISRQTPVRRNESYSQLYRPGRTSQPQYSGRSGISNRQITGMPQSFSRSGSNNYRSRSVDMGRVSRPSGQSGSMRSMARSSGPSHSGRASVSPGRSSGSSRSSGSGHSGSSSGRR